MLQAYFDVAFWERLATWRIPTRRLVLRCHYLGTHTISKAGVSEVIALLERETSKYDPRVMARRFVHFLEYKDIDVADILATGGTIYPIAACLFSSDELRESLVLEGAFTAYMRRLWGMARSQSPTEIFTALHHGFDLASE